jgi:hypothetical protein
VFFFCETKKKKARGMLINGLVPNHPPRRANCVERAVPVLNFKLTFKPQGATVSAPSVNFGRKKV